MDNVESFFGHPASLSDDSLGLVAPEVVYIDNVSSYRQTGWVLSDSGLFE
jgi:hypothetical protein